MSRRVSSPDYLKTFVVAKIIGQGQREFFVRCGWYSANINDATRYTPIGAKLTAGRKGYGHYALSVDECKMRVIE